MATKKKRAADGERPRGDDGPGGPGPNGELMALEEPVDWRLQVMLALYRLGETLAPRILQTLSRGMWVITYGRIRQVAFVASFTIAFIICCAVILAVGHLGAPLGTPLGALVAFGVSIVVAVLVNVLAVWRGRLSTPELEELLALFDHADDQYRAINLYAEQQGKSGVSGAKLKAELARKRQKVVSLLLRGLQEVGDRRRQRRDALPAAAAALGPGAPIDAGGGSGTDPLPPVTE